MLACTTMNRPLTILFLLMLSAAAAGAITFTRWAPQCLSSTPSVAIGRTMLLEGCR